MIRPGRALRAVVLTAMLVGVALPIAAGLILTLHAAIGRVPGLETVSAPALSMLLTQPGFATSLRVTLVTGLVSTLLAVVLALALTMAKGGRMVRWLALPLAVPHAAVAVGLAFLFAPSGWIARLIAPVAGWDQPPAIITLGDAAGVALIIGLLVKEVPFLLVVCLAASARLPVAQSLRAGRALGHSAASIWLWVLVPQLYRLIRMPVFVTLAFSLSVVDMAIILGPSNPPTLAVAVTRWFNDPDPAMIAPASAGALVLVVLVGLCVGLWMLAERLIAGLGLALLRGGRRGRWLGIATSLLAWAGFGSILMSGLALVVLLLWSVGWRWPFPAFLPESWTVVAWMDGAWGRPMARTLGLGLATALISLLLALAWLEGEDRGHLPRARWATALLALPLLLPQIGFLFGLNVLYLHLGISGTALAVVWAQSLFVFPYVMIALSDPWRAMDLRMIRAAASLGAGPWRQFFAVKLPLMLRPILLAAAIGFAVSVAQYLPTLFAGAGRIATLTTEAVTLSSGSDRRVLAVQSLLQAMLPALVYGLAMAVPALLWRNRRDMGLPHEP